jgi:hypothetical protein
MKNLILEKIAEAKESQKMIALLDLSINHLSFNYKDMSFDDITSLDEEFLKENNLIRNIDEESSSFKIASLYTSDYTVQPSIFIHFIGIK